MKKHLLLTMMMALTIGVQAQTKFVGGDISMLTKYEDAGVKYKDKNGTDVQPLKFFYDQGLNAMRVRLFVNPSNATTAEKKEGVCQDIAYVTALGKRIKQAGFKLMLDFHYSDTWADPAKQWTPKDWLDLTDEQLYERIYNYTKESLTTLTKAGVIPDFIQTGNEISYGILYGKGIITKNTDAETKYETSSGTYKKCYTSSTANWDRFTTLLKNAGKACRDICPDAKIILHTERSAQPTTLTAFYDKMKTAGVDYDIIGLSYYPAYHQSIATLENAIKALENKSYGKDIMIVETGYSYAWALNETSFDYTATYPYTEEGQRKFTADLITMLNKHSSVTGLFWWWMEDNGNTSVTPKWWNAALYDHNTGKPYAALYELKNFVSANTGIRDIKTKKVTDDAWYRLDGQRMSTKPATKGIYIHQGRKVINR